MTKEFGTGLPTYSSRLAAETARLAEMRAAAEPPEAMRAAPVAPARGTMQLVQGWDIQPGGTRRAAGAHWIVPSMLDVINEQAPYRPSAKDPEAAPTKVAVFTPSQVAVANRYRDLVEWRAGSAIKCSKLEGGSGGGGSGEFIDAFIAAGQELAKLEAAIGSDVVLSPRRNMDRGNGRETLTVRQALDAVVLKGRTISQVITRAGWAAKGTTRREVRDAIRGALDRMQGYR
ncbi:MAG: hypothetical protein ACOH2H_16130 [Cypionkella sp.]